MRIFSINSKFYAFLTTLLQVIKLNFLWVLFSIPIITIGASTVAAYSVSLRMVKNEEGHVGRQFVHAFKENWKQGIPLGLITILLGYFVYLNLEFFYSIENSTILFFIAALLVAFVGLFHIVFAYPIIARYETTLIQALINSKNISTRYFLRTLLLWFIIAILIAIFIYNYTLVFFGLLIGPMAIIFTVSSFASYFFDQIEIENKS